MEISSTKYRVGMPPVRPLPLKNSDKVAGICSSRVLDELYRKVADILRAHDITLPNPVKGWEVKCATEGDGADEDKEEEEEEEEEYNGWDDAWDDNREDPSISLVYRSIPDDPDSARLTLLIIAHWSNSNSPEAWELAVQAIRPLVLEYLPTQQEVYVEMIAENLTVPLYISPVGDDPIIAQSWSEISTKIYDALEGNPASQGTMTCIDVMRLGTVKSSENPITVYVSVSHECAETDWPPIIAEIEKIIEPYHLELRLQHDNWNYLAGNPEPRSLGKMSMRLLNQPYQERPNLGADIGAAVYTMHDQERDSPPLGTLGCYIDVITEHGEMKTMALTSYHVCRPCISGYQLEGSNGDLHNGRRVPDSDLRTFDREGVSPSDAHRLSPMEHPARLRHKTKVRTLQAKIADFREGTGKDYKKRQLADFEAVFNTGRNILGKVWAASGFDRRIPNTDFLMDWALIEVNENRRGTNDLPGAHTWDVECATGDIPNEAGWMTLRMDQNGPVFSRLKSGTTVYKYGAATGPTAGIFSGQYARVGIPKPDASQPTSYQERQTNQHLKQTCVFIVDASDEVPLAGHGDSGAVVFSGDGHALGVVVSSLSLNQTTNQDRVCVIPMEMVFDDIKALTKAKEVKLHMG
ncbi:unnamed protein product [Clonostachys rosea]|uniref:Peptidase S7 domain-containing protein n=1 Tax=Bionectria ochroleuca TaxID=29856 RepID=A0ABY6U416_BIOOC|nr:unnamed protein product [Clonostachys rosea]